MHVPDPGWDWFQTPPALDQSHKLAVARAFARIFAGPDGQAALEHLRAITVERCLGPDSSDAALRSLEGGRRLVRHITSLIEAGRDGALHS